MLISLVTWGPREALGIFRWYGVLRSKLFIPHLFSIIIQVAQDWGLGPDDLHTPHIAHSWLSEPVFDTEGEWAQWLPVPSFWWLLGCTARRLPIPSSAQVLAAPCKPRWWCTHWSLLAPEPPSLLSWCSSCFCLQWTGRVARNQRVYSYALEFTLAKETNEIPWFLVSLSQRHGRRRLVPDHREVIVPRATGNLPNHE